ncbi:ABC-type glycerol-3-phosphate transport system substrate-binding protein [Kribbella sp. VKM Ac-2527]|uniref:ABC-type glycerol-3-phosphate transport system substrate-binding protein n=1 Tax=Kribbella caucasensis TaxID=2512215 RepID=A0A4R6KFE6_9ACTN|nr:extracellular solute-binding protein [Kribbella sp. VKM Ac-2527]TDO49379.1 ABC-type glycerol-3-phosphate transport system substrate-binding protein [Kribbella sp. VKM Ac-2527]
MALSTRPIAVAAGLLAGLALTACSGLTPSTNGDSGDQLVLRVQGKPSPTDKAALDQFDRLVAEFEKQNPGIKIEGTENKWDPLTFATKLAGKSIEDVIQAPLTEPPGLIARKQVQPITGPLKSWNHYQEFNPQVLKVLSDSAGDVYGVPLAPFAQGLVYNRKLFTQAGLNPDKPPTTWDEVRAAAKQIAEKTGKAGFVHESKGNTGGWQLTMGTYSRGGSMESEQGGKYVASFNSEPTKSALTWLQTLRWSDNAMGQNHLVDQDDVVKQFAAGQIGMFMGTPGTYRLAKMKFGLKNTADYGITSLPQSGGSATLAGADVFMVPASVSKEKAEAAVKWLLFAYIEPQFDPQVAAERAKELAANPEAAVGVPTLPLFSAAQQEKINAATKPYVNVELENFKPWLDGTAKLQLQPEPPVAAQKVYTILDTVVQSVLTKRDADIAALLAKAEADVNKVLAAEQK